MATTENEIPACVTHVARLESGILTGTWDREEFERYRDAERVNAQQYRPLAPEPLLASLFQGPAPEPFELAVRMRDVSVRYGDTQVLDKINWRSEEPTSELQSLMRNTYDVFCLKKK